MENLLKGRIHSFESFGSLDGPGIRFVIFMQGCSLKCKYCHNRDTWDLNSGTFYSTDEIIEKILRYKSYIDASNGGITISGGEPLLQQDFLFDLITKFKKLNFHVAIDTSGSFELTNKLKKIIDITDLFLLDIKCINDNICKDLTGVSNKKELEFAKYLSSINKPMWIRQVLVPGITDNEKDLIELKNFVSSLSSVERVEVIPYHDFGKFKWNKLGLEYPLENVRVANNEDILKAKSILGIN